MRREASRRQLEAAKKEREAADARQSARDQQAAAEKQQQARQHKERIERLKATWKDDKAASKARARCPLPQAPGDQGARLPDAGRAPCRGPCDEETRLGKLRAARAPLRLAPPSRRRVRGGRGAVQPARGKESGGCSLPSAGRLAAPHSPAASEQPNPPAAHVTGATAPWPHSAHMAERPMSTVTLCGGGRRWRRATR
jgi:hypothetical protein